MPKEPLNLSTGISSQNGYLKNISFETLGLNTANFRKDSVKIVIVEKIAI